MNKTVIEAGNSRYFPDFGELRKYNHLIYSLAWRDLRVKYAQTYVGFLWAFINPIFNLVILSFVFGVVAKVDTNGYPQAVFTIAGLSAWTYFSTLMSEAGTSIIGAQGMIKKVYFPRLVIPMSKALSGLVDLGITLSCLVVLLFIYGVPPSSNIIYLPIFIGFAIFSGLAGGILVSALVTRYRDFTFVVPMIVRLGLFASPIAYSASSVPEHYRMLYYLNPMAGVVEGFRWSILGTDPPDPLMFYSIGIIFVLLIAGLYYFAQVERTMADVL